MKKYLLIAFLLLAVFLLQFTLLPVYLRDPFQPNLIIIVVVYLGLKLPHRLAPAAAFVLGMLQDCFSGICLGMNAFSYLCICTVLCEIADRLFTDNRLLLVMVVTVATVVNGILDLLMLGLFSVSNGIYSTLLPALLPQALVNAFVASLLFNVSLKPVEEPR